tara:strand:+ start:189 stop:455 length:267 start_codon:yes stop_codon:yes gene_type:complete
MRNRAIKISVSMPLKLVEELDKLTTYKGKSRSQYISGAVTQRLKARKVDSMDDPPISYLLSALRSNHECPKYLIPILEFAMNEMQRSD